jgi:hypothetical protein
MRCVGKVLNFVNFSFQASLSWLAQSNWVMIYLASTLPVNIILFLTVCALLLRPLVAHCLLHDFH